MAEKKRLNEIRALGLNFPLWVFDVDQRSAPRKIAEIPHNARPAKITGWFEWCWEYGTTVGRIDDPLPLGVISTVDCSPKSLGSAQQVLDRLRHDDQFEPSNFQVLCQGGSFQDDRTISDLCDWFVEPLLGNRKAVEGIMRIERKWDGVPFWDREAKINIFQNYDFQSHTAYGFAIFVENDIQLLQASGASKHDAGDGIRKAEIEMLTEEMETLQGIVYPKRSHPPNRLVLSAGPDDWQNKNLLAGTALENAPWWQVKDYILGKRGSPLT